MWPTFLFLSLFVAPSAPDVWLFLLFYVEFGFRNFESSQIHPLDVWTFPYLASSLQKFLLQFKTRILSQEIYIQNAQQWIKMNGNVNRFPPFLLKFCFNPDIENLLQFRLFDINTAVFHIYDIAHQRPRVRWN